MLDEIEELFKSEELAKNKNLINALLYHADVYRNPKSSASAKAEAKEAIKMIGQGKSPEKKTANPRVKTRKEVSGQVIQPPPAANVKGVGEPIIPKPPKAKLKYDPMYQHYNVNEQMWNKHPEIQQHTIDFHNEVMSGKHPEHEKVRQIAQQKMKKSLENVLESLKTINAHLTHPKQSG